MNDEQVAARAIVARAREEMRIGGEAARMRSSGASEDEIGRYLAWDWSITENELREERRADERATALRNAVMQTWPMRIIYAAVDWLAARLERSA